LRASAEAAALPILAHPAFVCGMLAVALLTLATWLLRRVRVGPPMPTVCAIVATIVGVLFFVSTTLEVARSASKLTSDPLAQGAAVSIFWAMLSVVMLTVGFARRIDLVRHLGLGLLGVAGLKAVVIDLSGVSPEWRIVSLVAVGLLMLGVSLAYAKIAARLTSKDEPARPTPHDGID
jgi:uncharacterized membrane protein